MAIAVRLLLPRPLPAPTPGSRGNFGGPGFLDPNEQRWSGPGRRGPQSPTPLDRIIPQLNPLPPWPLDAPTFPPLPLPDIGMGAGVGSSTGTGETQIDPGKQTTTTETVVPLAPGWAHARTSSSIGGTGSIKGSALYGYLLPFQTVQGTIGYNQIPTPGGQPHAFSYYRDYGNQYSQRYFWTDTYGRQSGSQPWNPATGSTATVITSVVAAVPSIKDQIAKGDTRSASAASAGAIMKGLSGRAATQPRALDREYVKRGASRGLRRHLAATVVAGEFAPTRPANPPLVVGVPPGVGTLPQNPVVVLPDGQVRPGIIVRPLVGSRPSVAFRAGAVAASTPHVRSKPRPGTKERKGALDKNGVPYRVSGFWERFVGEATEALDVMDVAHDSLPPKYQAKPRCSAPYDPRDKGAYEAAAKSVGYDPKGMLHSNAIRRFQVRTPKSIRSGEGGDHTLLKPGESRYGKERHDKRLSRGAMVRVCKAPSMREKANAVYKHANQIDVTRLLTGMAAENLEDFFYGTAGRSFSNAAKSAGLRNGFMLGPAL